MFDIIIKQAENTISFEGIMADKVKDYSEWISKYHSLINNNTCMNQVKFFEDCIEMLRYKISAISDLQISYHRCKHDYP